MKLEEAKLQNTYKSNPNEISKERFKSKEQKGALKILNSFTNYEKLLLTRLRLGGGGGGGGGGGFFFTENLNLHYF